MKKQKVYHYSYDFVENPWCGGGGAYRNLALHQLLLNKYDIRFYVGAFPGAKSGARDGIPVTILGWGRKYWLSRLTFCIIATIHSLFSRATLKVIAFSAYSPVLGFLLFPHRFILEFHHILGRESRRKYGVAGLIPALSEWIALRRGTYFITSADSVAKRISDAGGRAVAVYNGFDSDLLSQNTQDGHYLLTFGRIDIYMKGLDILLKAFATIAGQFTEYRLVIAGKGQDSDIKRLRAMIAEHPYGGRIDLRLFVSPEDKKTLLTNATLVCIPSRFEGWCIVAIEAAAVSKPVVGTRVTGLSDTVRDGETGVLVPPENSEELATAVGRLLNDTKLRKRLSQNGYHWAQKFTWEETALRQGEIYDRVIRRKPWPPNEP